MFFCIIGKCPALSYDTKPSGRFTISYSQYEQMKNKNIVKITKMTYKNIKIHKFIDNNFCICYNGNKKWDQSQ